MNAYIPVTRRLFAALGILAAGGLCAQADQPRPAPIARWSFETLKDGVVSGSGPHGRPGDLLGAASLAPGVVGNAISFQAGPVGRLVMPLDLNTALAGPFTLSLWVRPTAKILGSYGVLFDAGGSRGFVLRTNIANRVSFSIGRQWNAILPADRLPMNQWTHLAVTSDGTIARLYLNGVEAGFYACAQAPQFPAEASIGAVEEIVTLPNGAKTPSPANGFIGEIDEVEVYDQALAGRQLGELAAPRR
jgi:hypothetical protein